MNNLARVLVSLYFIYSFFSISVAQPILNWNKIYDYLHMQELPNQVIVDDSGNIYIIGEVEISQNPATNMDAAILKYDPYGNLLWYKLKHLANWGGTDIYLRAIITNEGNILVSGEMQVDNTSKMYNVLYSPEGNVLWDDTRDYMTYWPYKCRNIFVSDSSYYITDVFYYNNSLKTALLHYDNLGQFINVTEFKEFDGGPENITFSDSSLLLTYTQMDSNYQYRSIIRNLSLSGREEWETVVSDTLLSILSIKSIIDQNKNIYSISNRVYEDTSGYYLTKLNSQGIIIWDTTLIFKKDYFGGATDITILDSGLIKIVGTWSYWDGGTTSEWGIFVALHDTNGNLIDYKSHTLPYIVQNYAVPKYDKFGNVYWSFGIQNTMGYLDILIMKIDQFGQLEYEFVYSHNNNQTYNEEPIDMFIVDEDNYVISARGSGIAEAYNILTLRYGSTYTSVDYNANQDFISYDLSQNYPNPFNPSTKISYSLAGLSKVSLKIYDILGREIVTLVNEEKPAGKYEVNFNANNLASGVYFYQIKTVDPSTSSGQVFIQSKKMILIK